MAEKAPSVNQCRPVWRAGLRWDTGVPKWGGGIGFDGLHSSSFVQVCDVTASVCPSDVYRERVSSSCARREASQAPIRRKMEVSNVHAVSMKRRSSSNDLTFVFFFFYSWYSPNRFSGPMLTPSPAPYLHKWSVDFLFFKGEILSGCC